MSNIASGGTTAALFGHIQNFWLYLPELTANPIDWSAILDILDKNGEIDCSWAHNWFNALRSDSNLSDAQKTLVASKIEKTLTTRGWVLKVNGTAADFSDTALGKTPCTAADKCTLAPVVAAPTP